MANLNARNGNHEKPRRSPSSRVPAISVSVPAAISPTTTASAVTIPTATEVMSAANKEASLTETETDAVEATPQEIADYKKSCQEQHDRYTSHLWDQRGDSQSEADKLVVTLASASLALSTSFLKDVVPIAQSVFLPLLFLSWGCFGTSIISTLVSYYLNLQNVNEHLQQCQAYFFDGNQHAFDDVMKKTRWTENCNKTSATAFVVGLALTLLFIGTNLQKEHDYMGTNKETQTAKMVQPSKPQAVDPNTAPFSKTPPPPPILPKAPSASTSDKPSDSGNKGAKS